MESSWRQSFLGTNSQGCFLADRELCEPSHGFDHTNIPGRARLKAQYPLFWNVNPVSQVPSGIDEVLVARDAVIFSIDFEALCRQKLAMGDIRFSPVTEVGVAVCDLRLIAKELRPGDRATNWNTYMRTLHLIVEQYSHHCGHTCDVQWCRKAEPYRFGFGDSKPIAEGDLSACIDAI